MCIRDRNNGNATYFDVSCTTTKSDGQFTTTTIAVSGIATMAHIDRLHQDTEYDCCVASHYMKDLPLNFTAKTCTSIKTQTQFDSDDSKSCSYIINITIGLGIALGVVILLLVVIATGTFVQWKKNQ